jgi:hypothetical protein
MMVIVTLPDGKGQVGVEIIPTEILTGAHDGPKVYVNYREREADVWMPVDEVEVKNGPGRMPGHPVVG